MPIFRIVILRTISFLQYFTQIVYIKSLGPYQANIIKKLRSMVSIFYTKPYKSCLTHQN